MTDMGCAPLPRVATRAVCGAWLAVRVEAAAKLSPEEVQEKVLIGVLVDRDRRSYEEEYALVRAKAKAKMR